MRQDSSFEPERLADLVGAVEFLCALPSVPAPGWCEAAVRAIAPVFAPAGVLVSIIDAGAGPRHAEVELAAAEAPPSHGSSLVLLSAMARSAPAWAALCGAGSTAVVSGSVDDLAGADPRGEAVGSWSSLGAGPVMAACAPIDHSAPSRRVLLGVGLIGPGRAATAEGEAALESLCGLIARRARRAFGAGPISPAAMLTTREHEVLMMLAHGESVADIASRLGRSPHTIHDYVKALHRKLGATNRGVLISRALLGAAVGRGSSRRSRSDHGRRSA